MEFLSVSIAPPPTGSSEVEYYQPAKVSLLITNKSTERLLIEQTILRFQSDANAASIYVEHNCGWEIGPGELRDQLVAVTPTPVYLANTNVFDVMVRFRPFVAGTLGTQSSEIHRGEHLILRNASRPCGQLFISFKQPDDLRFARLFEKLALRAGFSPYTAIHDATPGTDLWKRIDSELKKSVAAIIIWTRHTDWGGGVQREIRLARRYKVPDILLVEDQIEIPSQYRDSEMEYLRFDPEDPAPAFSEVLTSRRKLLLHP